MKKFYTICAAALCSISMIAATPEVSQLNTQLSRVKHNPGKTMLKKMQTRADEESSIYGTYAWAYFSALQGGGDTMATVEIEAGENAGDVVITGLFYEYPLYASYDEETSTLSIPKQVLFYNNYYEEDVYFGRCNFTITDEGDLVNERVDDPFEAVYDGDGFIVDENEAFEVYVEEGWYMYGIWSEITPYEPYIEDPDMGYEWTEAGTAEFADGWITSSWGLDPEYNTWNVKVERAEGVEGIYRLVNPYDETTSPVWQYNEDPDAQGYIIFNVADKAYPFVYPGHYCGFSDAYGHYYCYDANGYYTLVAGYTSDQVLAQAEEDEELASELSYIADTKLYIPLSVFGDSEATRDEPSSAAWYDGSTLSIIDLSNLTTAIKNVAADDANAPVEYYNLQGVRVSNPENGLFVKKQGSSVSKVIINK